MIETYKLLFQFNLHAFYRNSTEGMIGCILADEAGLCLGGISFFSYHILHFGGLYIFK